jgi:type I restriction enzyme S subunit
MGTVGRCAYAPENLPLCISTKHLCVITPDRSRILPEYLWASILYDETVRQQTRIAGAGAIMEGWNSTIIRNLRIRIPSLERQRAFTARFAEVERLKTGQAISRQRLDDLFQSLLQRAFQGEL